MNFDVFKNISYGVYIVSSMDKDKPVGCLINTAMQITATPATIAISINHENYTNKCIAENGKFAISILPENTSLEVIGRFGFRSSKEINKFENIDYIIEQGLPVINNSCGYIICNVIKTMETDTHTVFLGEILDANGYNDYTPMTYAYYHKELKGKSPKNAPTYIKDKTNTKTTKWKCNICGYIYEGEEIPDDFRCPICGAGKENFIKLEA